MNGISPFPAPCDSPWCFCRSPTMASSSPRHRAPFTNTYSSFFYICTYVHVCLCACVYVRAVRARWKNTDHFLAFSHGQRHFTDIFHPSPSIPLSPTSRFATRGVDRPGMQSTLQGRGRYVIHRFVSANRDRGCDPSAGNWQWNSLRARGAFITYQFPNAAASIFRSVCYQSQPLRSSITPPVGHEFHRDRRGYRVRVYTISSENSNFSWCKTRAVYQDKMRIYGAIGRDYSSLNMKHTRHR